MNEFSFDAFARALNEARPRRSVVRILAGSGIAGLFGLGIEDDLEAKKRKSCGPCRRKKRGKCRKKRQDGIPCGTNGYCDNGRCRECSQLGTTCAEDFECCSGICDRYNGLCSDLRIACDPAITGQCGNGLCCPDPEVPPTGHRCFEDPLTNTKACGTTCENLENCLNISGPTRCENGQCCCLEATCTRSNGTPVPPCA